MIHIQKVIAVLFVLSIAPLGAAENKKKQFVMRYKNEFSHEILRYDTNAHIEVNAVWLEATHGVVRYEKSNTFWVPKGTDAKHIHPTLIPVRYPDYEVDKIEWK